MKKSSIYLFIAMIALASCKKNNVTELEIGRPMPLQKKSAPTSPNAQRMSGISAKYGSIDLDYARDCTHWGPGVCLRLEWWEEMELRMGSFEQIVAADNNTTGNSEHGPIAFSVEGNRMRLCFFRDLEENSFRLETNERIEGPLAEFFGFTAIILHAGDYALDRSRLQYGEAIVNATFE